jgi:hypothetical protein
MNSPLCAVRSPDLRHFISFGDKIVGRDVQVWEGGEVCLTETFVLLVIPIPIRRVCDKVGAEILIENSYVLLVSEFCCVDPDEILVLFFH